MIYQSNSRAQISLGHQHGLLHLEALFGVGFLNLKGLEPRPRTVFHPLRLDHDRFGHFRKGFRGTQWSAGNQ